MLDAGIISLPSLWPNSVSPRSSDRTCTPQVPRAMTGPLNTVDKSAWSRRTAATDSFVATDGPACGAACALQPTVAASAAIAISRVKARLVLDRIAAAP